MERVPFNTEAEMDAIRADRVSRGFIEVAEQRHLEGNFLVFKTPAEVADAAARDNRRTRIRQLLASGDWDTTQRNELLRLVVTELEFYSAGEIWSY